MKNKYWLINKTLYIKAQPYAGKRTYTIVLMAIVNHLLVWIASLCSMRQFDTLLESFEKSEPQQRGFTPMHSHDMALSILRKYKTAFTSNHNLISIISLLCTNTINHPAMFVYHSVAQQPIVYKAKIYYCVSRICCTTSLADPRKCHAPVVIAM